MSVPVRFSCCVVVIRIVHDKSSDLVFELEIKHDKFAVFTCDVRFEHKTEAQERETSVFLL